MLRLENVCRTIGSFRLADISLSVGMGDYVIILGPTACGKTMLLETIAGIGRPEQGTIFIGGRDVTHVPPEKRNIGFVYQRSMLFPHYTVEQNIRYGMRLHQVPADEQRRRLDRLAEILGIGCLLGRDVRNLSGGELQKVAFARALAIEPPILLLDEPLAPLDPPTREVMRGEILKMHAQLQTTIVHVSHDQVTARVLGRKIGVMQNGRIMQFGLAAEVFEKPANEFTARFIGMENVFRGVAAPAPDGAVLTVGGATIKARTELRGPVGLCVGPDAIDVVAPGRTFANVLDGTVKDVSDRGGVFRVGVDAGGLPFIVHVGRADYERRPLAAGARVKLGFDGGKVHCFPIDGGR